MARLALLAAVAIVLAGCGSGGAGTRPKRAAGGNGDPYVTWAQVRRVSVGMSAKATFRLLGGKAYSGQHTVQPFEYDYPIWGTGTGDAAGGEDDAPNSTYSYLIICVKGGRVVDTNRHQSLVEGCQAEERSDKEAAQARRIGPIVTVARGPDWVLRGWRSTYGSCVIYRPRYPGVGRPVCGFGHPLDCCNPQVLSPETIEVYVRSLGRKTLIVAAFAPRVSSVKVTVTGRRPLRVHLHRPPRALGMRWRFVRLVVPTGSATGRPPWRVLALNSAGGRIGRFGPDLRHSPQPVSVRVMPP